MNVSLLKRLALLTCVIPGVVACQSGTSSGMTDGIPPASSGLAHRWSHSFGLGMAGGTAVANDGRIIVTGATYVGGRRTPTSVEGIHGVRMELAAVTGDLLSRTLVGDFLTNPVVGPDGAVVVGLTASGTNDGQIGAISLEGPSPATLVATLDPDGSVRWAQRLSSSWTGYVPVLVDGQGRIVVASYASEAVTIGGASLPADGTNVARTFLAKLDTTGRAVWTKRFSNPLLGVSAMAALDTGGVIAGGIGGGSEDLGNGLVVAADPAFPHIGVGFVAALSADGNATWVRTFRSAVPTTVAAAPDGTIVVAGTIGYAADLGAGRLTARGERGDIDGFVMLLSGSGDQLWSASFGDEQNQRVTAAAIRPDGLVAITGSFAGTMELGSRHLTSAGFDDAFVATFDRGGRALGAARFGDDKDDQIGYGVVFDSAGDLVIAGSFASQIDLGGGALPQAGMVERGSQRGSDSAIFVAKLAVQ